MERSPESWHRAARVSQVGVYISGLLYGAIPFVDLAVVKHIEMSHIVIGQGFAVGLGTINLAINHYASRREHLEQNNTSVNQAPPASC